jgi:serine/threonine protein phosphatase PrpC
MDETMNPPSLPLPTPQQPQPQQNRIHPASGAVAGDERGECIVNVNADTRKQTAPSSLSSPSTDNDHQHQPRPQQKVILSVSTFEEMNPSRRSSHEDCSIYEEAGAWGSPDPDMALLAICDGHGGRDMVDYLEHGLVFHVAEELKAPQPSSSSCGAEVTSLDDGCGYGNDPEEEHRQDDVVLSTNGHPPNEKTEVVVDDIPLRLERAFLMADIHSKCLGVKTSGATVALCLVKRHRCRSEKNVGNNKNLTWTIHAANAGDARIVLGHQGLATRLTHDHRSDDPEEVARIEGRGGFLFKGRVLGVLAVTRSLGDHMMKEYVIANPFCKSITISKQNEDETTFIICACDGLFDVMSDQEAVDFVLEHVDKKDAIAQLLVTEALNRGSTDNITVTVAWL